MNAHIRRRDGTFTSLTIALIETPFDMARSLADLALRLDEGKFAFPVEMQARALACASTMYGMAEMLAGDRAEEVVGESDGSESERAPDGRDTNGWWNL